MTLPLGGGGDTTAKEKRNWVLYRQEKTGGVGGELKDPIHTKALERDRGYRKKGSLVPGGTRRARREAPYFWTHHTMGGGEKWGTTTDPL